MRPMMQLNSVVLPAPLSPSTAVILHLFDRERKIVERPNGAVLFCDVR